MAFAPLDAWARLLLRPARGIAARYWLRLGFGLITSVFGTAATLPERLLLAPILRWRAARSETTLRHDAGAVVVLGYFRSGTTHLHYLLSCDPQFRSPRWCETLAPQGWLLTWSFLRVFMIPFLSAKRPQDDVAIGPDWPAEDDFACNNWTLTSSLPSRFVIPSRHEHDARFHDLSRLSVAELGRWRWTQWAFVQKLAWISPGRAILLKSPSHTARVGELDRLLSGRRKVRFVHISRDPAAVIQSNVNMAQRLGVYNLEDPPAQEETRRRVVEEYLASEEKYVAEAAGLEAGQLVEIRYEDLVADPMGTLRRVYRELGLEWTEAFERRVLAYLTTVRDYKPANQRDAKASSAAGGDERERARIEALTRRFGHDRPATARVEPERVDLRGGRAGRWRGVAALAGVWVAILVLWLVLAWVAGNRYDRLIWPIGMAIGWTVIRVAREGSTRLGLVTAAATLMLYVAHAWPSTFLADYGQRGAAFASPERPTGYLAGPGQARAFWGLSPWVTMDRWEWYHINLASRRALFGQSTMFWVAMGVVTAYRFASRKHVHPPGTG